MENRWKYTGDTRRAKRDDVPEEREFVPRPRRRRAVTPVHGTRARKRSTIFTLVNCRSRHGNSNEEKKKNASKGKKGTILLHTSRRLEDVNVLLFSRNKPDVAL